MPTSQAADVQARPPGSDAARDRCGGYVLMELLVAMAIIAMIAALAMPAGSTARSPSALRAKALDIAVLMRSARNLAVRTGVARSVELDPASRAVRSERGRVQLPRDVAARFDMQSGGSFVFAPDGRATPGRLILSSDGLKAVIAVDPMTAAVYVEPN